MSLRVSTLGFVDNVGCFTRLALIVSTYRSKTGFGFFCGLSKNPNPVLLRIYGKDFIGATITMLEDLCSKIDISASRLKPYEGFIFLCGGPTDVRSNVPVSIRDAIQRELVKYPLLEARIRLAEDYKDWSNDAIYRDLVSFEKHLAELSSLIVLVLESAGSIAELGLFSVIDEFQKKLLVIIETDHYNSDSFIKLGPIDFLEKTHENSAECHRWVKREGRCSIFDAQAASEIQPELVDAIRERVSAGTPERAFQPKGWLDVALLTCDLLGLCSALTLREIKSSLDLIGCPRSEAELKQILFVMQRLELIAMEPKGSLRFYISRNSQEFVKLHLLDQKFDLNRFRIDLLSQYERKDKKRFRAIQEARRRYA